MHKTFTKESIRHLRLRLGWTQSDLARNVGCSIQIIEDLEKGHLIPEAALASELEIIEKHADELSDEVHNLPLTENKMEESHLDQIEFTRVLNDLT